jgi:hypothetical protein
VILSIRHKFILVRGRKVAGTSVEMALSTLCGDGDIVSPMVPVDELQRQRIGGYCGNYSDDPRFERAYLKVVLNATETELGAIPLPRSRYHAHSSLRQIEAAYPRSIAGFRVICIERNPYAKVISALNMRRGYADAMDGGDSSSLPDRIVRDLDKALLRGGLERLRSIELYRSASGAIVAEPLRYESLREDCDSFLRSIGVTHSVRLPHAKKGLMANRIDPACIFRRDQLDAINALFAEEFERFGYRRI